VDRDQTLDALTGGENVDINVLFITNALEHKDIVNKLDALVVTLERIEEHTKATNGRVAALEIWRWLAAGAIIVLVPIVFFLINTALYNSGAIKKFEQMHAKELTNTPTQTVDK
jgi:hypothetical protein